MRQPGWRPGTSADGSMADKPSGPATPGVPNPVTCVPTAYAPRGALRDGAAGLLRLPPRGRHRADGEPVPARSGPAAAGRMRITTRWSRTATSAPGRYRPKVAAADPAADPDEQFDELFAGLGSHRDRALVAFWVSTGARRRNCSARPRRRRPGPAADHGDPQGIPGAAAAAGFAGRVRVAAALPVRDGRSGPGGPDEPLWWTLRRPFRRLTYHAARAMFTRAERGARRATGRCTTFVTPPPTGWPATRRCR